MAIKKTESTEERIELGDFTTTDNSDAGGVEIRFNDEKNQGNGVLRKKSLRGSFERGAIYTLYAVKKEEAPQPDKTVVEVPTEQLDDLPEGAKAVK